MKRLGHVWEQIISPDNLREAIRKAARGKRRRANVARVLDNVDTHVSALHELLASGQYRTSQYNVKIIYEPKERQIFCLPFYPDRIVHHAVMNVLESYWDKKLIYDTYSCRKGKGQHKGSTRCMEHVRKYRYVLKGDVSKFYPSIDHVVMKGILRRHFKDAKLLALLDEIIDSANTTGTHPEGKNCPIGNLLSQWFGNLYLGELDTFVKQELRCKPYIRYCDDFVLFSNDKNQLHEWRTRIEEFLADKLKLKLSKRAVFPVSHGIDFLGYRHFPEKVLVRKRTVRKWRQFFARLVLPPTRHQVAQLCSFHGIMSWAQSFNLRTALYAQV